MIPGTVVPNLVIIARIYLVLDSAEQELGKVMKTGSPLSTHPVFVSAHLTLPCRIPSLHLWAPIHTHICGFHCYLLADDPRSPCISSDHLFTAERNPGGGPQVHQRLCAWNRPDLPLRPVPPSSLSLWMAPSFSSLHIWKPGCLPQLLPPVYCLVQSRLPSQSTF